MADRFWNPAGNPANWNDTSSWAAEDGGATGETVPTFADDVYFTSTNNNNCTVDTTALTNNLDFSGETGYTGTITTTGQIVNVSGSLTLSASMTTAGTGSWYVWEGGAANITTNGCTINAASFRFSVAGNDYTLQDGFTFSGTQVVFSDGTLDTNNQDVNVIGLFNAGDTNARTLTLGSTTLTCKQLDFNPATNLTFNENTSTINCIGAEFDGGGETFYDVDLDYAATQSLKSSNSFHDLSTEGGIGEVLNIYADQTVTGTFTITGDGISDRKVVKSDSGGTARTITAAVTSITNADIKDITGAGAADWDAPRTSGCRDKGGNTGIDFNTNWGSLQSTSWGNLATINGVNIASIANRSSVT